MLIIYAPLILQGGSLTYATFENHRKKVQGLEKIIFIYYGVNTWEFNF